MSEVDGNAGVDSELLVIAHLFALVVREGLLEFCRNRLERFRVRLPDRNRVLLPSQRNEECVPCGALNKGAERRPLVLPEDEVALPVARHRSVGDFSGPLLNGEHVGYPATLFLEVPLPLPAVCMLLPERLHEHPLQFSPGEHIDEAVYGLVADAHRHIGRILCFQALLYLPGRPFLPEASEDARAQMCFPR